jgi:phosphohistidine phosphatase
MQLLLVRHADAVAETENLDDYARYLSARGRARALSSAAQLAEHGFHIARMLTSPRVRAVQTAELFARTLGFAGEVQVLPSLCFSVPARVAAQALLALGQPLVAFGHMPSIAEIVQQLTDGTGPRSLDTAQVVGIRSGRIELVISAR